MAGVNVTATEEKVYTHEGAVAAAHVTPREQLIRSVVSTLLWEPQHYETGDEIANRLVRLVEGAKDQDVAEIAVLARTTMKLRQVPLWITAALAWKYRNGHPPAKLIEDTVARIVLRPDQASEFLAMYWKLNGRELTKRGQPKKISAQGKKGLARAFNRWDEYRLSKWDESDKTIKLRDVLFLSHAKPTDAVQADLWKRFVARTLDSPDTWEVNLSSGKDKKETWERLIREDKLGYIALLANLRNCLKVGIDEALLKNAILSGAKGSWALPYRFISAARAAPGLEGTLSEALEIASTGYRKLPGRTCLVIDVSGSMRSGLGSLSKINRIDAAGALAVTTRALCESAAIYATAGSDIKQVHKTEQIPDRQGLGLIDALTLAHHHLGGGGIFLTQCMKYIDEHEPRGFDRVLVFTDEQDCDNNPAKSPRFAKRLGKTNYIMNVASYENGIATDGGWERINGFSDGVLNFISFNETGEVLAGN